MELRTRILCFPYPNKISLNDLADDLYHVSGGAVHLHEVDYGTEDTWAVLSNQPLTAGQALEIFEANGAR